MRPAALIALAALCCCACEQPAPVSQPISYNHKVHVENGLQCEGCHQSVRTAAAATLPAIDTCMMCHQAAITESPEEEKVRQYAEKGEQIPWQRVYAVPDHVYFSHRRHVAAGQIGCEQCHGPIREMTVPVTRPLVDQSMDWCMRCHMARTASTDCIHCHR